MTQAILAFATYLIVAVGLLVAFVLIFMKVTPYDDAKLIANDNNAVAITLAGSIIGFTFPLVSAIYYTRSLAEMAVWAVITCVIQLIIFGILRRISPRVEDGHMASAILVAAFSIAIGMLNAVCISH